MWMRRGCNRLLGVCLAMGYGAIGAGRADAGFSDPALPGPVASLTAPSGPNQDFTPRCEAPELNLDPSSAPDRSASALDLPDAHDFRTGQKSDDHLVARLTGDSPKGKASYSLFWEDLGHTAVERGISDFGVDVKSANPVVVPLPPGVWAGLAVLGGIAIHQIRRHRKQLA